jgi:hypothetical protein
MKKLVRSWLLLFCLVGAFSASAQRGYDGPETCLTGAFQKIYDSVCLLKPIPKKLSP